MNFSTLQRVEEVMVELKYCERCGGLWLRRRGMAGIHCGGCRTRLAELAHTRLMNALPERKKPRPARVDSLLGVVEEVRA